MSDLKKEALDWFYSIERTYREAAETNGEDSIFLCRADYTRLAIEAIENTRQPDPRLGEIVERLDEFVEKNSTVSHWIGVGRFLKEIKAIAERES